MFDCSKTCGGGKRVKTRTKLVTEVGTPCKGLATIQEDCNTAKCEDKYPILISYNDTSLCSILKFHKLIKTFFFYIAKFNVNGVIGLMVGVLAHAVVEPEPCLERKLK